MYRATHDGWTFTVTDKDGVATDITGWNIWYEAKASKNDADGSVFQKAVGSGVTILNQTTNKGQCEVALVPADTAALDYGANNLIYQWKIKDSGGATIKILEEGTLQVSGNVTRATA
jgi:hypothetical protein